MKKIIIGLLCLFSFQVFANTDFPGRKRYPQVPYIAIDKLFEIKDSVVFIDARSPYEYGTLRVKGAELIPLTLGTSQFKKKLLEIREKSPGKIIVFYCNGHKCMKSYKAAKRAISYVGLDNVFAFDAGIFDWAQKYPEEALLLDKPLENPAKLISKDNFKKHILEAEKFIKTASDDVEILDIRDRIERDGFYIFSGHEKSISMAKKDQQKLDEFFNNIKKSNKTLYVYDMVGKQVRWFQYYIESHGIKKYFFMEGGAESFFKLNLTKLMDGEG